jgi:hypothetical protein
MSWISAIWLTGALALTCAHSDSHMPQESGANSSNRTPLTAADLQKIDRTIAKEPTFKTKPRYGLLVFGPKAKTRIWLVLDGDVLYVDRNGQGDLADKGNGVRPTAWGPIPGLNDPSQRQRFFNIGQVCEADGKRKQYLFSASRSG